jgi:hypothetical protein
MAFSDLSFKLYTDSNLTTPFSGLYQLVHNQDFSDNPQDFNLYFGSNDSTTQIQAVSNPGVDNITLTPAFLLLPWVLSTAYAVGDVVTPTVPNGKRFTVVTAGTTSSSEPTWPTVLGSQVTDGSVVWQYTSPTHPATEIKLALTSMGLSSATGGAALDIGNTIQGGTVNAVRFYMRITNTVSRVGTTIGHSEIGININEIVESTI